MAEITIVNAGLDTNSAVIRVNGLKASEALEAGEIVYLSDVDTVSLASTSNKVVSNGEVKVLGIVARAYEANDPVTVFGVGTRMQYATGMDAGTYLWACSTAGKLNTTAISGDRPVAVALNSTDILIVR